jgi:hypothetical protein
MVRAVLAAALILLGAAGACAQSKSIFDLFTGGFSTAGREAGAWQGTWGIAGKTPVVTVAGSAVSYVGSDEQPFTVSGISITATAVTFQAGGAVVALTRQSDNAVAMVSTMGDHSSPPILLCRADAPRCP